MSEGTTKTDNKQMRDCNYKHRNIGVASSKWQVASDKRQLKWVLTRRPDWVPEMAKVKTNNNSNYGSENSGWLL